MEFEDLGKRIKEKRESMGLTLAQLAEISGIHETSISRYENGSGMEIFSLYKIASALNSSMDELCFGSNKSAISGKDYKKSTFGEDFCNAVLFFAKNFDCRMYNNEDGYDYDYSSNSPILLISLQNYYYLYREIADKIIKSCANKDLKDTVAFKKYEKEVISTYAKQIDKYLDDNDLNKVIGNKK